MIITRPAELESIDVAAYRRPARAKRVLLCPPDHYEIREARNPHMQGHAGDVDSDAAREEWQGLVAALEAGGQRVERLPASPDLPDMVFTANPSLGGLDRDGEPFAIASRMRYPERRAETDAHVDWWRSQGIRIVELELPEDVAWEGGGDTLWHPDRYWLWGGHGQRSGRVAFEILGERLDVPICLVRLVDPVFYHLDTCLALLDEESAAWIPAAFDEAGRALIEAGFPRLVEVDAEEARDRLAGNLYCPDGRRVLLPAGSPRTRARLEKAGYEVVEVVTDEYLKSGGSVYCLRQEVFGE